MERKVGNNTKTVTITEGTNIAVSVSPDHERLVMDLQGVLWTMPLTGGKATKVTGNFADPALPDWSPDGERIVFQSYKTGNYHIWIMRPDGTDVHQLTFGSYDHREPSFSPDGTRVAFSSDRGGNYDIWVLNLETRDLSRWTDSTDEEYQPTWSPDGSKIAFVNGSNIEAVDAFGNRHTLVEAESGIASPSWSPDGERIAYTSGSNLMISGKQITQGEDVFPFPVEWLSPNEVVYTADGHIKKRKLNQEKSEMIPFSVQITLEQRDYKHQEHDFDSRKSRPVKGIVSPKISPNGKQVAFVALNDLWLWNIGKGKPFRLTNNPYLEMAPSWSPDGNKLAYSSDKAGTLDIYILDLKSGEERKLTSLLDSAEMYADWSPDGTQIAFQDQNGATYTVNVDTGDVKQVVESLNAPGSPTWGPEGKTIAFAAIKTFSNRFREGTNQILTIDLQKGANDYVEPIPSDPFKSLSNRENSGPEWSPDGKHMAFVVESQLYVMPVGKNGAPTEEPRLITDDIAEAPSWSGDSNTLLYLSKGKLKLVSIDSGETQTLSFNMKWQPQQPRGRTVIHAGRLWDGTSPEVKENMDIIIDGNRIVDIKPHKETHHGKFIDAGDLTVIPGLWDSHIHQEMARYTSGNASRVGRQLLAFGITSTISMGDIVYRAIEERESIRSGASLGPRFFATGELIEGSRVYYNVMRPTTSMEALKRELERAKALDYDLIKTYVRFPNNHQAYVIEEAHKMGIPVFSHYFFPSMAFGQDATSHMSATQRLGFSRTISEGGYAYQDVIRLMANSEMGMTSTLFESSRLLAFYPELFYSDPRLKTLYTPWQYNELKKSFEHSSTEYSEVLAKDVAILKEIVDAGGLILAGTDTPIEDVAVPLHTNLLAMAKYGMTPYEALRTATYNPAKIMGVADDLGTVEEGKLADLVFVDGNPLQDISDAANVKKVIKNGEIYTMDNIMKPFDE